MRQFSQGIEFNKYLRWIDVMNEVAFVTMDLSKRGHSDFAHRFLNLYLQHTGDYEGLVVFSYYLVYRAIVRDKVAMLRISQKYISEIQEKIIIPANGSKSSLSYIHPQQFCIRTHV